MPVQVLSQTLPGEGTGTREQPQTAENTVEKNRRGAAK